MKTLLVVLMIAAVGIALAPEAVAHTCSSGSIWGIPISFSWDGGHGGVGGHPCLYVGRTAILP